ncbi:hypothetical protein B9Z19DRAFT_965148 [Tuber borchii]|uniref:Uncharacterized protein n=1 Tax=Tuber borchii TaxID=42251 RepID=A0A2T7A6N7_TUBBO|nr:hypothetical protein B9Z19DRAFT_965148 [Tuber borchii]
MRGTMQLTSNAWGDLEEKCRFVGPHNSVSQSDCLIDNVRSEAGQSQMIGSFFVVFFFFLRIFFPSRGVKEGQSLIMSQIIFPCGGKQDSCPHGDYRCECCAEHAISIANPRHCEHSLFIGPS